MNKRLFTQEEIEELSKNKYVSKVTPNCILYTEEFKSLYYQEYCNGLSTLQIFKNYGFDLDVLGRDRIHKFASDLRKKAKALESFEDKRQYKTGPVRKALTKDEEIEQLRRQVSILKHENDFLKRIEFIDKKYQADQAPSNKP